MLRDGPDILVDDALVALDGWKKITEPSRKGLVTFAVLAHDFGKPPTTEFVDGRLRSREHEEAGVEPTIGLLNKLNVHTLDGYDVRGQVVALVRDHLKGQGLPLGQMVGRQVFGYAPDLKPPIRDAPTARRLLAAAGYPVLVGSSRKSFIGRLTGIKEERLRDPASVWLAVEDASRQARVVQLESTCERPAPRY